MIAPLRRFWGGANGAKMFAGGTRRQDPFGLNETGREKIARIFLNGPPDQLSDLFEDRM